MRFLYWLTGGRPMHLLGYDFTDKVSGKSVYRFLDGYGRIYLAEHAWSLFRVRSVSGDNLGCYN